jgi:pimeloyl-ACP methyl ester carboxylesterase
MNKDFALFTKFQNKINISTFGFENLSCSPCLILVHGFKGFKDWGFGPFIGEYFAKKGFFVITFNFSHNGVGDNLFDFVEMDKFAENTFSLEISELGELIEKYSSGFFGNTQNKKIFLLGHSRGGAISILTSKLKDEVSAVAVWASVSKLDRYSSRQKDMWRKKGFFEVLNTRTNQVMRLNISLLDDVEQNKDGLLNIQKAVASLYRPLFIAHGDQDLAVPIKEAEDLYSWSQKSKTEFYKIIGAGHTFDIKHPFEGSNLKFDKLLDKTYEFFSNS